MKYIGIVGAGASGICAAKYAMSFNMTPIIWEQTDHLAGTWVYSSVKGQDKYGLPINSSMYKNLRTNLPKEVMAFPDFPFPAHEESFLHHSQVLKYLEEYAEHFGIIPCIKFNHYVTFIRPLVTKDGNVNWEVKVRNLVDRVPSSYTCDAVLICSGHYSVPLYPDILDINLFKGIKIHSHEYRCPTQMEDQTIVVLGAGSSGVDIAVEVSEVAKLVYLSHNLKPITTILPSNVIQVKGIEKAGENGFVLNDGLHINADRIIYCTGYKYSFPFLSEECGVYIQNNQIGPLYKHLILTTYPTMAFVGLPYKICPFPLFDMQVQFFLKFIDDKIVLPDKEHMDKDTNDELLHKQSCGMSLQHFHHLGNSQWAYNKELADMAKIPYLMPVIEKLYKHVESDRKKDLLNYRNHKYRFMDSETFYIIC